MDAAPLDPSAPISWMARCFVEEDCPDTPAPILTVLEAIVSGLISGGVSTRSAASACQLLTGTSKPIDRLAEILVVANGPLPPARSTPVVRPCGARKRMELWSDYEDLRLLAGVHRHGLDAWSLVAAFVGNSRTSAQCSQRWIRGLDPRLSRSQWTPEEDQRLLGLVARLGRKSWMKVAGFFANRCDIQCRYRFCQLEKAKRVTSVKPKVQLPSIESLLTTFGQSEKATLPTVSPDNVS